MIYPIVSSVGTILEKVEATGDALSTWEGEGGALGVTRDETIEQEDALSTWEGEGGALGVE